ncbi:MAG: type VI secretion system tip protein VgrG [Bacteroidetes bacterium]|nr:type VI secretion system tip protein VgrG [Bacteroidota bacterium]MBU1720215.1 type VI secretion system tip protein VgrG [Bacteroidota bacterium]
MAKPTPSGLVNCVVLAGGSELPGTYQVISVHTYKEVNRIPAATIQIIDGDPASGKFELSEKDDLKPGKDVEIKAGYDAASATIFKGVITKISAKARSGSSYLQVECKDKAFKLTIAHGNELYEKKKDSDIIGTLIGNAAGVTKGTVDATTVTHKQLLQYGCTDWDFLVSRAEHNGMLVLINDNKIDVKKPDTASAALTLEYGTNIYELDADLDGASQIGKVSATGYDIATLATKKKDVSAVTFTEAGNLKNADLKTVSGKDDAIFHPGTVEETELEQWGKSRLLRSKMARLTGRVTCDGFAALKTGDTLELKGLGARFNGMVFVSGVEQKISSGNWLTTVHFGMSAAWHHEKFQIGTPPAAGRLPAVHGLQMGIVKKLHSDPDSQNRIQVELPIFGAGKLVWARMIFADAGKARGLFFMPEVGDEVLVGFLDDDARFPIVLGTLYSSKAAPPVSVSDDKNNTKGIYSREKITIEFNDEKKILTIKTPGGNQVVLDDDAKAVTVKDSGGNQISLKGSTLEIKAKQDLKLTAAGKIILNATGDLTLNGMNVKAAANAQFSAEGKAGVEVKTSAIAILKGSMVKIN